MHAVSTNQIAYILHVNNNIYYILPLTMIIVLAVKGVSFSKVRKSLRNIFAMHYGNIKD